MSHGAGKHHVARDPIRPEQTAREPNQCLLCWLELHPEQRHVQPPALAAAPSAKPRDCRHLGKATGEKVDCPGCGYDSEGKARRRLGLYACARFGQCTPLTPLPGVACCHNCPAREAFPPIERRNLLYHLYPVAGNGVWRQNVRELCRRMGLFNGRRVVAIATGPGTGTPLAERRGKGREGRDLECLDPPSEVRAAFAGHKIEFYEIPNNPHLGEVASFEALYETVESLDPTEATFWGHAKGVIRPPDHPAHPWTHILYEVYLDYWPFVERLLRQHPIAGAFKKIGQAWPSQQSLSQWHYSGSFLWFRNAELFKQPDWRRIDRFWSGVEPMPSLKWGVHEAATIFMEGPVSAIQFYPTGKPNTGHDFIARTVQPALLKWRAEHGADYREWPS